MRSLQHADALPKVSSPGSQAGNGVNRLELVSDLRSRRLLFELSDSRWFAFPPRLALTGGSKRFRLRTR